MIYFLTTAAHRYTIRNHLRSYGAGLRKLVRPMSYEQLFRSRRLQRGVYIFADVERLWPDDAELAAKFWHIMHECGGFRLLNHPTRSLRRYELLRTMHQRGINDFNVYRLGEQRLPENYPVYLRGENDHNGNRTPLLQNRDDLLAAIQQVDVQGRSRDNTLIVEFCNTAREGFYKKYSAFCVGGVFVPRHLCFARKWMVKQPMLTDKHFLDEEQAYLAGNPHEQRLREIFQIARIDYGRIDYGIKDGKLQVWEINSNPTICLNAVAGGAARTTLQVEFARKLESAFAAVASVSAGVRGSIRVNPKDPTRIRKPKTLVQRIKQALRVAKWRAA